MATKRLLGVFAHPGDEAFISGALAKYGEQGVETGLVYATCGEVGEVSDDILATPDNLGEVREAETREAADVLNVQRIWFLNYRDSGARGTADNHHPQAFLQARPADAMGKLVAIIREFHPQVIITFDESGGEGNPDHIAIYKYTIGAFHAAADEALYPELGTAYSVSKLYYTSFARRQILMMTEWLQDEAFDNVFKDLDLDNLGFPDDQINVLLDVEPWQEKKNRSWDMHRSQVNPANLPISRLPKELQRKWRSNEYYQLATSRVGPDLLGDNDLFAHVS
ncbi:MAG TPA: PIG-L deacetylase family protein [Dictyobacter sp.]|jgi:LmbE family N-acetylglucosaminyl deacetylase|nr:PIG-L deacetylase family protein [Dictyobacter sp.]